VLARCHYHTGVSGGAGHGFLGAGLRGVSVTRPALFPNSTHGANGPTWRNMETAGFRCVCTPTGNNSIKHY
jgi:hypothetical protein